MSVFIIFTATDIIGMRSGGAYPTSGSVLEVYNWSIDVTDSSTTSLDIDFCFVASYRLVVGAFLSCRPCELCAGGGVREEEVIHFAAARSGLITISLYSRRLMAVARGRLWFAGRICRTVTPQL